jgi:NAD(P)H-dependent flavin oxidoreductase YrpB (nitropropane dioxygenase family)
MTQVAAELRISVGALTTAMNKLVKKGYVNRFRVPEDRRIVKVELTQGGAAAAAEHTHFHEKMIRSILDPMTEEQCCLLAHSMESIDEFVKMQAVCPLHENRDLSLRPIRIGDMEIPAPIFQGDLGVAFSSPRLAAAVAACGGVGVLSAEQAGFAEADYAQNPAAANIRALQRNIRDAAARIGGAARKGAVAANIVCASTQYENLVRAAAAAGVRMITSGAGIPTALPGLVKDADVKLVPIVSSARAVAVLRKSWAKKYNRAPDAVILAGPRVSGHLGFREEQLDDAENRWYHTIVEVRKELADLPNCPLIVSNGTMRRADLKKVLACGADGIQIEEAFLGAAESDAPAAGRGGYADAGRRGGGGG